MIEPFGALGDGTPVEEVTLKKGFLEAKVLSLGATIRDLKVHGKSVILGFDTLEGYLNHSPYCGVIAGRVANRIKDGNLEIDGKTYQLALNENGVTHLHGGTTGFSRRVWTFEQHDNASVLLKLVSEDGDQGYPGRLETLVRYTLTGAGALRIKISAKTDQTTPVNLTQHSYFNLDGSESILDHNLEIAAEEYLPVDERKIPTGERRKVAWTPFDFRSGRRIRRGPADAAESYDHNFCLAENRREAVEFAAALEDSNGGMRMEVWTTEPGLQFYDGGKVDIQEPGFDGRVYGPNSGLCLEAQCWPDSVNHAAFPSVLLQPGQSYNHITEYRFS